MDTALLLARLALAVVFLVAGLAKLADAAGSRRALLQFGVPRAVVAPLAGALPLAELAVAALLLTSSTAAWGAAGALGLLVAFAGAIALSLVRGRRPDCHCFGQLHSAPAGPATLGRNLALAALAGAVVWAELNGGAGPSALAWIAHSPLATPAGALALGAYVLSAGLGWGLLALLRQNGRLMLRVEALEGQASGGAPAPGAGLPVGTAAPAFRLPSVDGGEVALDGLLTAGRPALLVFSDPACGPCRELLPDVARWQTEHAALWTTVIVSRGDVEANRDQARRYGLHHVLVQADREVAAAYGCPGTPGAVLVGADGWIASPLLLGPDAVRAWAEEAATSGVAPARRAAPPTLPVGAPAPDVRLPMLDGPEFSLSDLQGAEAVLVLWNPRCGYCRRMLPDLQALEAELAAEPAAPRLVVVSAGAPEANREQGLRSPVLLDDDFALGRALGAQGTPSAVRIDARGRIASSVAVGAEAVLALARSPRTEPVPAH